MLDAIFGELALALLRAVADAKLEGGVVRVAPAAERADPRLAGLGLEHRRRMLGAGAPPGLAAQHLQERAGKEEQIVRHRHRHARAGRAAAVDEGPDEARSAE